MRNRLSILAAALLVLTGSAIARTTLQDSENANAAAVAAAKEYQKAYVKRKQEIEAEPGCVALMENVKAAAAKAESAKRGEDSAARVTAASEVLTARTALSKYIDPKLEADPELSALKAAMVKASAYAKATESQFKADGAAEYAALMEKLRERKAKEAAAKPEAGEGQPPAAALPAWTNTIEIGLLALERGRETTFIKVDRSGAVVIIDKSPLIDRRRVLTRGTFQNQSTAPMRFTFDVRLGAPLKQGFNRGRNVVGSDRYQTPVLAPGELHKWEMAVAVTDTFDVADAAIGNVQAIPVQVGK